MRESGWYPPGAEYDPNAPYNQVESPEREYNIEATFDLRRTDELWSSNYDEFDNLNDAAKEWRKLHYTPLELILFTNHILVEINREDVCDDPEQAFAKFLAL